MAVIPFYQESQSWDDLGIDTRGRRTGEVKTLCPKCSHARKHKRDLCLSINIDEGLYNCHHCGWSGRLLGGESTPSRPRYEKPEKTYTTPLPVNQVKSVQQWAQELLINRGISMQTILEAGVTGTRQKMPRSDQVEDVVAFPFRRNGEIVNYKFYRPEEDGGKQCRQVFGAERIWYGLDWCQDAEQIIIVEGEIDALSMREAGYHAVLSVPDGAPKGNTKEYSTKFSFFDDAQTMFDQAAVVIIATDMDGPGEVLAAELVRRIGKQKCFRVRFPDDCKDANEVLTKHGVERLQRSVQESTPWPVEGVIAPHSLLRGVFMVREGTYYNGLSTGIPSLDKLYRPALGQLSVMVGVPQHGKTQVIDTLMLNLARLHGWSFATFSPENYPPELHMTHLIQRLYKRHITEITDEEIEKGINWLDRHVQIIAPEYPTLQEIIDRATQLIKRDGIKGLIIDPWTEVVEDGDNTQRFIKNGLTRLGRLKRDHDMHIFVMTHPRKLSEERDFDGMIKTPKPSGYDIADSAHFVNKADNVLTIWRDVDRNDSPIEVSVIKSRFREHGSRGTMLLNYDPKSQALSDGGSV